MSLGAFNPGVSPVVAGLKGRCPRCGVGRLFASFINLAPKCSSCDLDFGGLDAGDGPAVFIILIAGFLIAGGALIVEVKYQPSYWTHAAIWGPLILLLPLILLRPLKGVLLALHYHNKAGT